MSNLTCPLCHSAEIMETEKVFKCSNSHFPAEPGDCCFVFFRDCLKALGKPKTTTAEFVKLATGKRISLKLKSLKNGGKPFECEGELEPKAGGSGVHSIKLIFGDNTVLTVRLSGELETTLQNLCDSQKCDRAETTRRAIQFMSDHIDSNINQTPADNSEVLAAINRLSAQQSEVVALLEPLHSAGGPRYMHSRLMHIYTGLWELLTAEQKTSAVGNAVATLSKYGFDLESKKEA